MVEFISIVYVIVLAVMTIAFIVLWGTKAKEVQVYKSVGYLFALILIFFELIILIVNWELFSDPEMLIAVMVGDTFAFFRTIAVTLVGIDYCLRLKAPSFPKLLRLLWGEEKFEERVALMTAVAEEPVAEAEAFQFSGPPIVFEQPLGSANVAVSTAAEPQVEPVVKEPPLVFERLQHVTLAEYWGAIAIAVAAAAAFSSILFLATEPELSQYIRGNFTAQQLLDEAISFTSILIAIEFAFVEELIFRLGLQSFLSYELKWKGRQYWGVVLISTMIWTIGHAGVLDPNWVKMVQIFPLGILLGWMFKRYGTESVILVHALFNVTMVLLSPYVVIV